MDPARQDNAMIIGVAFILIRSTWYFHLKPLSISTPRKTPDVFALMVLLSLRAKFVFRSAFLFRDRCTSWYFNRSNLDPWRLAQAMHNSYASFNSWQFSNMLELVASRNTSSINPRAVNLLLVVQHISIRSSLWKKYKIGDLGDSWGIPVLIWISSKTHSLVLIMVDRLLMKLDIQSTIFKSMPRFLRLCRSLSCDTLSKAPVTSSMREEVSLPWYHLLYVFSTR